MNLLTSLALLGFVSRALAHAQLIILSEMQENSTNSKSNYPLSHLPLVDAVSTEFTPVVDENISDLSDTSYDSSNNHEGSASSSSSHPSDSSNLSSSSPSSEQTLIPSGATQLPGLHGRTPLIWRWNDAINKTIAQSSGRRVQRKSNDFSPRSSADCTKTVDDRSNKRPIDNDSSDREFDRDEDEDAPLNQRTGADRRAPSASQGRHGNRGIPADGRFDHDERRRHDYDDLDWSNDNNDNSESTAFTRRRNQNRRKPLKKVDQESDGVEESDDNYRQVTEEDKLDRRRDSTDDETDDYEDDSEYSVDTSRQSSHSSSSRRNNNRNRGYNRNYPDRRRNQSNRGDSDASFRKPYGKRPNFSELESKPYPKDNLPQATRRLKNHRKPYSSPHPSGFANPNSPGNRDDSLGHVNPPNNQFISLAGESTDDLLNLEDGATILDTHTGQTYEISIANARSSPISSLVPESIVQGPYTSVKSNYAKVPPSGSVDSLLSALLTRPNHQTVIVEPMAA